MFSFAGTAQEAGAGGRSGAAGIPVHGSLMGRFSLCIYMASFTFLLVHCGSLVSTLVLSSKVWVNLRDTRSHAIRTPHTCT